MNEIYEQNMRMLSEVSKNIEEKKSFLSKIDMEQRNLIEDSDGRIKFLYKDCYYNISSLYESEEIDYITKQIQEKKDYLIVVFGIGYLNLLKKIMEIVSKDSRILIFEPNPYILKYVLQNHDLSFLLESNQVGLQFEFDNQFAWEEEISDYAVLEWGNLVKNLRVISLPNTWIYQEKCRYTVTKLLSGIDTRIKILGNCLEDIFNGQENNYKNVDAILESNLLEEIKDKFEGYPAIVVASGPSLDKNIDILHEAQDKALILTCDASLEACKKNHVKPDAIASIERDIPTYLYYYKDKTFDDDLVLIGPSLLWPQIFEEYPGKKIITNKVGSGVEGWWASNFENFKFLNQGMSSANVAFAYAKYAGCNPIILIGQDLAFTGNKKHSELTHTEFEGENDSSESDGLMVEDIYGNMLPTDSAYNLFRKWFEMQTLNSKLKVIDATEGGAKISGSEIMTLREAIDQYCKERIPMHLADCLSERERLKPEQYIQKYEQLIKAAKKQQKRLRKLQNIAKKHYKTLEGLYKKNIMEMKTEELTEVVLKMQKGDKIIQNIQKDGYLVTYFQQMIRQTIIFVKSLGNELSPENVIQNIRFQGNLMGVIKNSSDIIYQEYEKMITFLEEKKKKREAECHERVCAKAD